MLAHAVVRILNDAGSDADALPPMPRGRALAAHAVAQQLVGVGPRFPRAPEAARRDVSVRADSARKRPSSFVLLERYLARSYGTPSA